MSSLRALMKVTSSSPDCQTSCKPANLRACLQEDSEVSSPPSDSPFCGDDDRAESTAFGHTDVQNVGYDDRIVVCSDGESVKMTVGKVTCVPRQRLQA